MGNNVRSPATWPYSPALWPWLINKLFVFSSRKRLIKSQVQKIDESAQFWKIKSYLTEKIYSSGDLLCVGEPLFCKGLLILYDFGSQIFKTFKIQNYNPFIFSKMNSSAALFWTILGFLIYKISRTQRSQRNPFRRLLKIIKKWAYLS